VSRTKTDAGAKGAAAQAAEPYDQIVARLEQVVEALEGGQLTLEQSIEKFAEGVTLSREAGRKLDEAERRVEALLRADDGGVETRPLDGGESVP
jgi:exodeoxyribonuclease VII small subunit